VPHLVDSITPAKYGEANVLTLARCHELLREAHDYLARRGMDATRRATLIESAASWGSALKRVRVELPRNDRPRLVREANDQHSLAEVMNQCATMERLLDALVWVQSEASGLSAFNVAVCHPTTSSAAGEASVEDNDLILTAPDGRRARFEVSDVASSSDGAHKEERDLRNLGVLGDGSGAQRFDVQWPSARVFLVVSSEFAVKLQSRRWPHLAYGVVFRGAGTVVAEALKRTASTSSR
jgi:hypothetical protein